MVDRDVDPVERVLASFDVGRPGRVALDPSGLIHRTYRVATERGDYALQRLHPALARDEVLEDYHAVTEHLASKGVPAPRLVLTRAGLRGLWLDGHLWRLATFLPGVTYSEVDSPAMAEEAGRVLGRFHLAMVDIPYRFRSTHPLHQTRRVVESFRAVVMSRRPGSIAAEVTELAGFVNAHLPTYVLESLPQWVVHGDPKISNVVFDVAPDRPGQRLGAGLIDLDTVNRHTRLVDLGDAARSWCRRGAEDQSTPFLLEHYRGLLAGYLALSPAPTGRERDALVAAPVSIALELAARFLVDAVEDRYFAWDAARYACRADHNVARARGCVTLAKSILTQTAAMRDVVGELAGSR